MIVTATGHRPKYMPCGYDESEPWAIEVKERLSTWLERNQPEVVITGMALGWDTWVAEEALALGIPIWPFIPFPDQHTKWPYEAKLRYANIMRQAAIHPLSREPHYTANQYYKEVFTDRDIQMVQRCDQVISLLNPIVNKGGTWYTCQYAKRMNKPITNFWA